MTIKELKEFYESDEHLELCITLTNKYGARVPQLHEGEIEDHADFWHSILDNIPDIKTQKLVFTIIQDLSFFEHFEFIRGADWDELEYMNKVLMPMINKTCGILDLRFLPGDYIKKPGCAPEKVVSITIDEDLQPRIHTERKKLIKDVCTYENIVEEDEFDAYQGVEEPDMYCERNEYGEYKEPYWDY